MHPQVVVPYSAAEAQERMRRIQARVMLEANMGLDAKAAFAVVADMCSSHVEMLSQQGPGGPLTGMK